MWEAHSDVIRAIQYINATDEPLVFSAGLDKMACIWGLDGTLRGKLLQGYMMKSHYFWDFPLSRHNQSNDERKEMTMDRLKDVKNKRKMDNAFKKQASQALARMNAKTTSLGFDGADLIGLNDGDPFPIGEHSKPANYVMNK